MANAKNKGDQYTIVVYQTAKEDKWKMTDGFSFKNEVEPKGVLKKQTITINRLTGKIELIK